MVLNYEVKGLSPYQRKLLALQPVAFFSLGDAAGLVSHDLSGSLYHGTSSGIVREGVYRNMRAPDGSRCARFDGAATGIEISAISPSSANSELTVSAWVNTDKSMLTGTTKGQVVLVGADSANRYGLEFDTTANRFAGTYFAGSGDATYTTITSDLVYNDRWAPYFGKWHHLCLTVSASADQAILYTNGSPSTAASGLGTFAGAFSATCSYIGRTAAGDYFKGFLSNICIFNSALDVNDVLKLYRIP